MDSTNKEKLIVNTKASEKGELNVHTNHPRSL
jgi:hypothetical protein